MDGRWFRRGILVVWMIVVVHFRGMQSQTITGPENTAARLDTEWVQLNCSTDDAGGIIWRYFPITDPTGSVITSSNPDFTISSDETTLSIKKLTTNFAVTYRCELRNPNFPNKFQTAQVVAMGPMECPSSQITYTEGELANMTCSVRYDEYIIDQSKRLQPTLALLSSAGNQINSTSDTTGGKLTLSGSAPMLGAYDGKTFTCKVDFQPKPPTYEDNCTTLLQVKHFVSAVVIYPLSTPENPLELDVGYTINCSANGRPYPNIYWSDTNGNEVSKTSTLDVTDSMVSQSQPVTYVCMANNSIDGGTNYRTANASITFIARKTLPGPVTGGVEPWVIAVAVVVPIVVIAIVAIVVILLCMRHKRKTAKPKTTRTANGTSYLAAATSDPTPYSQTNRGVPAPAPKSSPYYVVNPPGPDNRNIGVSRSTESPSGHGDLGVNGVRTYGGSNQGVNATLNSSRSSIGAMNTSPIVLNQNPTARAPNPKPNYPYTGSNQALNSPSVNMNPNPGPRTGSNGPNQALAGPGARPNYPYNGSNPQLNTNGAGMNANPGYNVFVPARQASVASTSSRSTPSYGGTLPVDSGRPHQTNDLSSMHGSEV